MSEIKEIPYWAARSKERLIESQELLCRTVSDTEEAQEKGDGYLYFTHPSGKKFPTRSGAFLIDRGEVFARKDGLFSDSSQTFEVNTKRS